MKWTIKNKMYLAFGIITLIIIGFSINIIISLKSSSNDLNNMKNISLKTNIAEQLRYDITRLWQSMNRAALTKDKQDIESSAKPLYEKAVSLIDKLENIDAESRSQLKILRKKVDTLYNTGNSMFNAFQISQANGISLMKNFDIASKDVIAEVEDFVNKKNILNKAGMNEVLSINKNTSSSTIIIAIIAVLLAVGISFKFTKALTSGIKRLIDGTKEFANGNSNVKIEVASKDELGELSVSFNDMIKNINKANEELLAEKADVERKVEEAVRESEEQKDYLNKSVDTMIVEMTKFSEGDLTISLKKERDDAIGKLYDSFNIAVKSIRAMTLRIIEAAQSIASATTQISSSAEEMAAGSQEQSSQATEIASAIEQMTATIIETTKNAGTAADLTKESSKIAQSGGQKVNEAINGIKGIAKVVKESSVSVSELGTNTDKISNIIQVIDEIADQTNLLALNAAIEAARAGEEGRGFAVVADEVRKLAERTTKATKEIAGMIKQIQNGMNEVVKQTKEAINETDGGIELAEKAGNELEKIIGTSQSVSDAVDQVATAGEEQSATAEQISKNIEQISNVTHESAVGVQQIAKAAEDLNRLTENLEQMTQRFKVEINEVDKSSLKVASNGTIYTS